MNKENGNCYPDCEVECTDYSCTRSNECMCKPGSEKTANSNRFVKLLFFNKSLFEGKIIRCKSICDDDYEWDTSESICRLKCSDGYYPTRNGSEQICKPLCSGGCLNGSCAEPEACQCSDGFEYNREFKGCIIRSDYCSVCSCVDTLFVYPFRPLNVPKLCFVMVLVAAIVVAIFCAISLFMYRRFIKRINHPFNLSISNGI